MIFLQYKNERRGITLVELLNVISFVRDIEIKNKEHLKIYIGGDNVVKVKGDNENDVFGRICYECFLKCNKT